MNLVSANGKIFREYTVTEYIKYPTLIMVIINSGYTSQKQRN